MDFNRLKAYMNTAENFNLHNGLVVTEIREGYCAAEVALTKWSLNPQGVAHGSLVFALCDVVTGVAAVTGGRSMLTMNSNINFLRPGTGKQLRAVAECIKDGRTTGLFEARVYDDNGKLVAKGDFTVYYTGQAVVLPGEEPLEGQPVWE